MIGIGEEFSPFHCQAITCITTGLLLTGRTGTSKSIIKILNLSLWATHMKMFPTSFRPFLNELKQMSSIIETSDFAIYKIMQTVPRMLLMIGFLFRILYVTSQVYFSCVLHFMNICIWFNVWLTSQYSCVGLHKIIIKTIVDDGVDFRYLIT